MPYVHVYTICIRVGIVHSSVICDSCRENDIKGMRWKCTKCYDFDLCTSCYMNGKHSLDHEFQRLDSPNTPWYVIYMDLCHFHFGNWFLFRKDKFIESKFWKTYPSQRIVSECWSFTWLWLDMGRPRWYIVCIYQLQIIICMYLSYTTTRPGVDYDYNQLHINFLL